MKNSLDVRSSFFLRVAFENKFSGANFCFSCLVVASCFFCGVLPMFLFYVTAFRSRTRFGKILLMSGLGFLGKNFCCKISISALRVLVPSNHSFCTVFFGSSPRSAGVNFFSCRVWFPATSIGKFSGANFCFKVSFSALRVLVPSSYT